MQTPHTSWVFIVLCILGGVYALSAAVAAPQNTAASPNAQSENPSAFSTPTTSPHIGLPADAYEPTPQNNTATIISAPALRKKPDSESTAPEHRVSKANHVPTAATTPTPTPPLQERAETTMATPVANTESLVEKINTATNNVREEEALSPLTLDPALSALAQARSDDMALHDYISHTSPDGCDMDCHFLTSHYSASAWGENIAWYSPYTRLTESALSEKFIHDWLTSRGHRENLLSSQFTHHGIGVALKNEKIIVTVIFARPK